MNLKTFVHKPTTVEALQWLGNSPYHRSQMKHIAKTNGLIFTKDSNRRLLVYCEGEEGKYGSHRNFVLEHGDWLVNIRGQWCRVEQAIFNEIYQEVDPYED